MTGDLGTELAASLTARDDHYRTLSTRIAFDDRCGMPIRPGVYCTLPGDHLVGCAAPERCACSHAKSVHTRGDGKCWNAACGCARFRVTA
jgi:hypothetical protein